MDTYATAINCMDGRVQLPVIEYIKAEYGVDYVDMITLPGPNRILAEGSDKSALEAVRQRLSISVDRHGSRLIAVVGHHDCAGNPTGRQTQTSHTLAAIELVRSWYPALEVVGLWINESWEVERIT
jgi:carbonic anhydrase